ncbi:MAG: hypothetical protein NTV36_00165, partial [Candidatus Staskawiczbacteria bacterium]|nr:hypothetical protein [Candidatus Staskawiczbacteria bacterium]
IDRRGVNVDVRLRAYIVRRVHVHGCRIRPVVLDSVLLGRDNARGRHNGEQNQKQNEQLTSHKGSPHTRVEIKPPFQWGPGS